MMKDFSCEKIFLLIALFFGLLYVFILPPFQSVDEGMHFYRTWQISQGRFVAKNVEGKVGDVLPKSLSDFENSYAPLIRNIDRKTNFNDIKQSFQLKLNENDTEFTQFTNTALYSPVCYVSQAAGVILAKVLNLPLGIIYYLGRLGNLLAYCVLVFFAIRIAPFFKVLMMFFALLPMSLSLAGAYTSDVAVFGLNFLWVALILKCISQKVENPVTKKQIGAFISLAFLISLAKSYVLLIPLIFLIPVKNFRNFKNYIFTVFAVIFTAAAGLGIWYLCCKGLTLNMNTGVANSVEQFAFIKSHPLEYLLILVKTFFVKAPRLLITMIGVLGWQDTRLDWITYISFPFLIYFGVRADNYDFALEKWQKWVTVLTLILGIVITYTSLYLMWTPVGNGVVLGLNGKYFIPMMLPFLLLFKSRNGKYDYGKVKLAISIAILLILLSSDFSLLHRFYELTPQLYYKV